MTERRWTEEVEQRLPLKRIEFLILLVLADGERHGYGLVQEIAERSAGSVRPLPGNLYAVLQRLMDEGLLLEAPHRPAPDLDDRRRRYYAVTDFGRRVLAADAELMRSLVNAVAEHDLVRGEVS